MMTTRGRWWRSAEIKPLTEDRKVLVQRYMIDADEAQARQAAEEAERRAAEELARREAAEEAERGAAEDVAEEAERRAAEQPTEGEMPAALVAAVERARLQAHAQARLQARHQEKAGRESVAQERAGLEPGAMERDGSEQQRTEVAEVLPIHGWVEAVAQSGDKEASSDWPRELVRLREEAQRSQ
jgi:hypothetical protein